MIKSGSEVKLHYTLHVDEKLVESSQGGEPLSYIHGQKQIIPGLEAQLEGLSAGEKKEVTVTPEQAYGERTDEAIRQVPKSAFQAPDQLNVGDMVSGEVGGNPFQARVADVGSEDVTLDLNHPLAGKTLAFEIEVVEVG